MNELNKHTAGPWEVVRVENLLAIMPDPITGRPDSFFGVATVQEHAGERSERRVEANARLIAAAPDLLAALEAFVGRYVALANSGDAGFWDPEDESEVIDARAAIAKAKGTP